MDANCFKASLAGQKTTAYLVNMVPSGGAEVDGRLCFLLPTNLLLEGVPLWQPVLGRILLKTQTWLTKRHKDCWHEQLTHCKRPWCWKRLKAEGEEGDRGWDVWVVPPIQWAWTWANSGRWWGTEKPGVLQPTGLWRVGHDLATEHQHKNSATLCIGHLTSTLQKRRRINDSRAFWEKGQTAF